MDHLELPHRSDNTRTSTDYFIIEEPLQQNYNKCCCSQPYWYTVVIINSVKVADTLKLPTVTLQCFFFLYVNILPTFMKWNNLNVLVEVAGRQTGRDQVSGTHFVMRKAECLGSRTVMCPVTATSCGRKTWSASSSLDWRTIACLSPGPVSCLMGPRGMSVKKVFPYSCQPRAKLKTKQHNRTRLFHGSCAVLTFTY